MANLFQLDFKIINQQYNFDKALSQQIGKVLEQGSFKTIKEGIRTNLSTLIQKGDFQAILKKIEDLEILQINNEIETYNDKAKRSQFHGLIDHTSHYEIQKNADNLKKNLFILEKLINELRSLILGEERVDFNVAVRDGNKYYFITDVNMDATNLLINGSIEHGYLNKNNLVMRGTAILPDIEKAIKDIQNNTHLQDLSLHFNTMMNIIPQISNPQSTPEVKWAAEVFSKHIQDYGQKNNINYNNWDHSWQPVRNFWDDYHKTHNTKNIQGKKYKLAAASQGGDAYNTLVKSFTIDKNNNWVTGINVINANNFKNMYSFWVNIKNKIEQNGKITDSIILEIMSVLLPQEKIVELGDATLASIREIAIK